MKNTSDMFAVTIQTAIFDEMPYPIHPNPKRFSVNGFVTSTSKSNPATAVTIIVNIPTISPITVVTNLPIVPPPPLGQPADFSFFGSIPGYPNTIPEGSTVTVYSNQQSNATKEIEITS